MRPRGEIRQALRAAFEQLAPNPATWRDVARVACVGYSVAKRTVCEMVRARELVPAGSQQRMAHARRPLSRYRLAAPVAEQAAPQGLGALGNVLHGWAAAPGAGGVIEGGDDVDA